VDPSVAPLPAPPVRSLAWVGDAASGRLRLLDQSLLPAEEVWLERGALAEVLGDILRLAVRGAPAIGVAAAYGTVLAAREAARAHPDDPAAAEGALRTGAEALSRCRPTAVNLAGAVARTLEAAGPRPRPEALLEAAQALEEEEVLASGAIARAGAAWLLGRRRVLTHCNAGALAAPGLGTALAPLYLLHALGEPLEVWVDETRPLLQGLRLTAWELARAGIPHAVLADGAAAELMRRGQVDAVIVGADRVCRNGDVVNKVGTYGLAIAARRHGIPFLVAAPLSTLDPLALSAEEVEVEERPGDGVRYLLPGTAPAGCAAFAPAFDRTPADLVTALVTDRGVVERPGPGTLAALAGSAASLHRTRRAGR